MFVYRYAFQNVISDFFFLSQLSSRCRTPVGNSVLVSLH